MIKTILKPGGTMEYEDQSFFSMVVSDMVFSSNTNNIRSHGDKGLFIF